MQMTMVPNIKCMVKCLKDSVAVVVIAVSRLRHLPTGLPFFYLTCIYVMAALVSDYLPTDPTSLHPHNLNVIL